MSGSTGRRRFRFIDAIATLLVGLAAFIVAAPARAVDPEQDLSQLHHTAWTTREGGPGSVWALAQTQDGMLWVGTGAGLYSFDGVSFERLARSPGEPSLAGEISALYTAPSGDLWIGGRLGGAYLLRGGHLREFDDLPRHTVFNFASDFDGRVWAATSTGLFWLDGHRWKPKELVPGAPPSVIQTLVVDRHGALWTAGSDGVFYLPRGSSAFVRARAGRYPVNVLLDQTGEAWESDMAGTVALTGAVRSFIPRSEDRPNSGPSATLAIDHEGTVWTVDRFGLGRVSVDLPIELKERHSLSAPTHHLGAGRTLSGRDPKVAFEDREGNFWIGTNAGLDRFRSSKLTRIRDDGFNLDAAAIAPAPGRGVWAGTDADGLLKIQSHVQLMHVLTGEGPHSGIVSLDQAADGTLWMGGRSELWRSTSDGFARVALPFDDPPTPIQAIATDSSGGVWISVPRQGLWRLAGGHWNAGSGVDGLPPGAPLSMAADSTGGLWFGYPNGEVALLVQGHVQRFGVAQGVGIGNVLAIRSLGDRVWFGGSDGVAVYRSGHFQVLHASQDDALLGVSGIAASADGDLWLNGVAGIARLPASEVEAFAQDGAHRVSMELLDALDGLDGQPEQLRPLASATTASDGRLWFATTQSIFWIDPRRMHRNALAPAVFVRSVNVGGERHAPVDGMTLAERTTNLDVDYAATSLTMPERVHFRYRLDGVDSAWQDAGTRRRAWYTNLRPGAYRFRVIACNEDGVWNSIGASISFTIAAGFYQTGWFAALCCVAGLALLWTLAMLRLRQLSDRVRLQLEARSRERERIARELHDTMLQGTQGLVLSFQVLADQLPSRDAMRLRMEGILDQADEVIAQARDSVMALRSADARQGDLRQRLAEVVAELSASGAPAPTITVSGTERPLTAEAIEEAFRIGREALLNAFRHAQARCLDLQLVYGEKVFKMTVRDDGVGIDAPTLAAGARPGHWGLTGMRERALRIDATLELGSTPGAGTEIRLLVPAARAYAPETSVAPWSRIRRLLGLVLPSKKSHDA